MAVDEDDDADGDMDGDSLEGDGAAVEDEEEHGTASGDYEFVTVFADVERKIE